MPGRVQAVVRQVPSFGAALRADIPIMRRSLMRSPPGLAGKPMSRSSAVGQRQA
jgi:hypothetical protein